jgi:hypothetical protein
MYSLPVIFNQLPKIFLSGLLLVYKSLPLAHIMRQMNPVQAFPTYLRSSLILSSHLRMGVLRDRFSSDFCTETLYVGTSVSVLYRAHLILLLL